MEEKDVVQLDGNDNKKDSQLVIQLASQVSHTLSLKKGGEGSEQDVTISPEVKNLLNQPTEKRRKAIRSAGEEVVQDDEEFMAEEAGLIVPHHQP